MESPPRLEPNQSPPATLASLVESTNEGFETAVNTAVNQAFNLGCLVGLLPAVIFALVTFLATGFSIIGGFMAIILGVIGAVAFANLAAMLTRRNNVERIFRESVENQIRDTLAPAGHTLPEFEQAAHQVLPPGALLLQFIKPPQADPSAASDVEEAVE